MYKIVEKGSGAPDEVIVGFDDVSMDEDSLVRLTNDVHTRSKKSGYRMGIPVDAFGVEAKIGWSNHEGLHEVLLVNAQALTVAVRGENEASLKVMADAFDTMKAARMFLALDIARTFRLAVENGSVDKALMVNEITRNCNDLAQWKSLEAKAANCLKLLRNVMHNKYANSGNPDLESLVETTRNLLLQTPPNQIRSAVRHNESITTPSPSPRR